MNDLENFVNSINDFYEKSASEQLVLFSYYLVEIKSSESFTQKDISDLYGALRLPPYSNISSYLSSHSKRGRNLNPIFLKTNNGYTLTGKELLRIKTILNGPIEHSPTDELLTISLFDDTRGYLLNIAKEAASSYDEGLYNSSLVMLRKLIETLIIELYEKLAIENNIKDSNGDYFPLSKLVNSFLSESSWNVSRNTRQSIPEVKKYADLAAHNRRFSAKKPDIDKIKTDLRITIEELLKLIDY